MFDKNAEVILSYRKQLLSYALYCTAGNKDLAEDLTQETLLKGIQAVDTLKDEKLMGYWLRCSLYNRFISETRKTSVKKSISIDGEGIEVRDRTDYQERILSSCDKRIIDYFSDTRINEGYRELLKDYYLKDMTVKQIAESRGLESPPVNTRVMRARRQLISLIEKDRMTRQEEEQRLFSKC
jgi:RNA polymerase sigma-70 factor (ECF subfamily)